MKLTAFSLFFLGTSLHAMQQQQPKITQEVKEEARRIADRSLEIYELKVAELYGRTFNEVVQEGDWALLSSICKPKYAFLLDKLLKEKKINVHTRYKFGPTFGTLLTQAVAISLNRRRKYGIIPATDRYSAVEVLLRHKADPNEETIASFEMDLVETRYNEEDYILFNYSPLLRALYDDNPDLVTLLLRYNADPNKYSNQRIPLMCALQRYRNLEKAELFDNKKSMYQIIEELLKKNADIHKPAQDSSGRVITPMKLAQELGFPEIVELFGRYQLL